LSKGTTLVTLIGNIASVEKTFIMVQEFTNIAIVSPKSLRSMLGSWKRHVQDRWGMRLRTYGNRSRRHGIRLAEYWQTLK
jgi:hypothetical protein